MTCIDETIKAVAARISKLQDLMARLHELQRDLNTITAPTEQTVPVMLSPALPRMKTGRALAPVRKAARGSIDYIGAAQKLKEPFTSDDLASAVGVINKNAGNYIQRWKKKGWLLEVSHCKYERTKIFGDWSAPAPAPVESKLLRDTSVLAIAPAPKPAPKPAQPKPASNHEPVKAEAPLSDASIALGLTLGEPFTSTDIQARLDGNSTKAYELIAGWKRKGWLETIAFGTYRRTAAFGK